MTLMSPSAPAAPVSSRLRLRSWGLWGVIATALGYLALTIPRMNDPYVIDEAVFPYVAQGILKNVAPFYYNGELRPADFGLWHPPLYDYLLAGFVGLFGFTPVAVRAFGVVCVLLSMVVLLQVLRRVMPAAPQGAYVLFSALVLLSPQVISGALIPDIDGSFGFLVVAIGLWLATIIRQTPLTVRVTALTFAFAVLSVSTKFTITGFIAAIIALAAVFSDTDRWKKLASVIGAFVAGTAVALLLLFAAGAIIGFDARLPFDYVLGSVASRTPGRGGIAGAWGTMFEGPGSTVLWVGPFLILAAVVAAIAVSIRKPEGVDARLVVLFVLGGVLIVVGYAFVSASPFQFPKYTPIAVPLFAAAATSLVRLIPSEVVRSLVTPPGRWVALAWSIVFAIGTVGMFFLARRSERLDSRNLGDLFLLSTAAFVALTIASLLAILLLLNEKTGRVTLPWGKLLQAGALIGLVFTPLMAGVSTASVNATATYSTRYYYGEQGMAEFLTKAASIIGPDDPIIGPKDIGFQLPRPFYEDALLFAEPVEEFRLFVAEKHIPFVVTRKTHDYSESIYPDYFAVIREDYVPVLDDPSSDFVLWKLKGS